MSASARRAGGPSGDPSEFNTYFDRFVGAELSTQARGGGNFLVIAGPRLSYPSHRTDCLFRKLYSELVSVLTVV